MHQLTDAEGKHQTAASTTIGEYKLSQKSSGAGRKMHDIFYVKCVLLHYAQVCLKEIINSAAECYHSPHNSLTSLVLTCQAMSP